MSTRTNPQQQGISTYTADTLREALALVRADLGPDALIIGQQKHGRRVSVEACLELPVTVAESGQGDLVETAPPENAPDAQPAQTAQPADVIVSESTVSKMVAAASDTPSWAKNYPPEVLDLLPNCDSLSEIRQLISTRLNYAHKTIPNLLGRYRFVGAAGVGKSTTLIKVLVEWVGHNNPRDVVVITTDNQRLAGNEALYLACQMLNVHICECADADLTKTIQRFAKKSLVLVDTPALRSGKTISNVNGLSNIWVCSALHGVAALESQYATVQPIHPQGVVITQLDQAIPCDELASLLYQWRVPLYWLGTGSELPDGIERADSDSVRRGFFPENRIVHLDMAV